MANLDLLLNHFTWNSNVNGSSEMHWKWGTETRRTRGVNDDKLQNAKRQHGLSQSNDAIPAKRQRYHSVPAATKGDNGYADFDSTASSAASAHTTDVHSNASFDRSVFAQEIHLANLIYISLQALLHGMGLFMKFHGKLKAFIGESGGVFAFSRHLVYDGLLFTLVVPNSGQKTNHR